MEEGRKARIKDSGNQHERIRTGAPQHSGQYAPFDIDIFETAPMEGGRRARNGSGEDALRDAGSAREGARKRASRYAE